MFDVVNVFRNGIAPLFVAHVAGEYFAEFIDPEVGGGPNTQGFAGASRNDVFAIRTKGEAFKIALTLQFEKDSFKILLVLEWLAVGFASPGFPRTRSVVRARLDKTAD